MPHSMNEVLGELLPLGPSILDALLAEGWELPITWIVIGVKGEVLVIELYEKEGKAHPKIVTRTPGEGITAPFIYVYTAKGKIVVQT